MIQPIDPMQELWIPVAWAVGFVLKKYTVVSNKMIPLIVWGITIVGYCVTTGDWSINGVLAGALRGAVALGFHTGGKNILEGVRGFLSGVKIGRG